MRSALLQVKIDNKQDVELHEFASAMFSLNDEYQRYINQAKKGKQKSDSRLMVNKISEGSIIVDLCENAEVLLPAIAPVIIEYGSFLIQTLNYLAGRDSRLPNFKFSKEDFLNFKKLLEPIANITGNTITINAFNIEHKTVVISDSFNHTESKAIQNQCDREIKRLNKTGENLIKENVSLKLYQARNSALSKSTQGNLGIIEDISDEPKVLSFASERLRYDITKGEENPLNFTYSVDIEIKLREGSLYLESPKDIKEYEILKLHGPIENKDLLN